MRSLDFKSESEWKN